MNFDDDRTYNELHDDNLPYQTKLDLWETAFGLQKTDNLFPSNKMVQLAQEHIEGNLNYQDVYHEITKYYDENVDDQERVEQRTEEADIASLRIVELLSSSSFSLTPPTLRFYHQKLFEGIEGFRYPVGKFRQVDIEKSEPVLSGRSVRYERSELLVQTLNWDFEQEKNFSYKGMSPEEIGHHAMKFISDIWQIHPFREGNTRTIAVFTIQYLRSFGFDVNNEPFKNYAQYFRDALALANDLMLYRNDDYLRLFTENVLFGRQHQLTRKSMFIQQLLAQREADKTLQEGLEKLPEKTLQQALLLPKLELNKLFDILVKENQSTAFEKRIEAANKQRHSSTPSHQMKENKDRGKTI